MRLALLSGSFQFDRKRAVTWFSRAAYGLITLATFSALSGCASLLPTSKSEVKMPWQDYAEAKATFDRIIVQHTTSDELNAMAISADVTPNIVSLNHTDLMRRLANVPLLDPGMLDDGLRACLIKRQKCTGLEIEQTHTERERIGSFWLDVLGFRQETSVTGWRFSARRKRGRVQSVERAAEYSQIRRGAQSTGAATRHRPSTLSQAVLISRSSSYRRTHTFSSHP